MFMLSTRVQIPRNKSSRLLRQELLQAFWHEPKWLLGSIMIGQT